MTNRDISKLLRNVAAAYSIKNEAKYRFQIIAYQKAADTIESATSEMKNLAAEGKLDTIPGVGPSLQKHIMELLETGKVKHFEELTADIPQAMFPLLDIPSFGPKKAFKLVTHFSLSDPDTVIEDVENLAKENKIASIDTFGAKSQADILRAIEEFRLGVTKNTRMVLPFASELADTLITYLKQSPHVTEASPLGSLRRRKETIGDIDIAVASDNPEDVVKHFISYPHKERVIEQGPVTASILISGGRHIDLMVQPKMRFGSLLQHFTGSKAHNIHLREYALKKKLSLSEYGIKQLSRKNEGKRHPGGAIEDVLAFDTEEAFYRALGLDWIPPEMREDTGEIELAASHSLPAVVDLKDIRGDFHLHSSFPIEPSHDMGKNTMEEMIEKAKTLGYDYLGFSEHNPSVSQHNDKEIFAILEKRSKYIDQIRSQDINSVRIFSLLETDILASGKLAINDDALSLLDATIVSIHSSFGMNKEEMTKRVLSGLAHPKAKILAHPTGRLLNQRNGYDLEWDKIFSYAVENNKALEINAFPSRLDLPDVLVRRARDAGVKFFIDTDSHATEQMNLMPYGVAVARRGWARKDDILNTWEYNKLKKWFES
jgi:DNA polymerase (family X)